MTLSTAALLSGAQDEHVGRDDRPRRRRFSAEYKLAILEEYERLTDPGAKGALLRREGLYSSHIVQRRAREVGAPRELGELAPESRRRRSATPQDQYSYSTGPVRGAANK
jgi:transposase-like protein